MTGIVEQLVQLHVALHGAALPHAFGGALALAWCTERARGTVDIDVNVFVPPTDAAALLAGLPPGVEVDDAARNLLERDGQARLWWEATPIDVFTSTTPFHDAAQRRIRWEPFGGDVLPFLSCDDLAVFKAFFDRTKDWADLEAMAAAGTLDLDRVTGVLVRHLGADDHRVERLASLAG